MLGLGVCTALVQESLADALELDRLLARRRLPWRASPVV
jgi:hypothetical protein